MNGGIQNPSSTRNRPTQRQAKAGSRKAERSKNAFKDGLPASMDVELEFLSKTAPPTDVARRKKPNTRFVQARPMAGCSSLNMIGNIVPPIAEPVDASPSAMGCFVLKAWATVETAGTNTRPLPVSHHITRQYNIRLWGKSYRFQRKHSATK